MKFKNRKHIPMHKSKKLFTRTAKKVHKKNMLINSNPMRGGIRL